MLENSDLEKIMQKLESIEDDQLAVELLKEFNLHSKELGKLLLNLDQSLSHDEWKKKCDEAQKNLDKIIHKINSY